MKQILFNTDMVRAILDGRKTVTRRVVKLPHCGYFEHEPPLGVVPPYRTGDVLYVRETWNSIRFGNGKKVPFHTEYWYKADDTPQNPDDKWRPSIHMPKEAARLFLRVTDVRVEQLRDITTDGITKEGIQSKKSEWAKTDFADTWNSTIKPADLDQYGWAANPWVWVIEFERIGKEEAKK